MLVQGSLPPGEEEKSCIIKTRGDGNMVCGGGAEEIEKYVCVGMVGGGGGGGNAELGAEWTTFSGRFCVQSVTFLQ